MDKEDGEKHFDIVVAYWDGAAGRFPFQRVARDLTKEVAEHKVEELERKPSRPHAIPEYRIVPAGEDL